MVMVKNLFLFFQKYSDRMADIEAALAKARALAKQAKSASEPGGGGLAAVAAARTSAVSLQPDGRVGSVTRNLNSDAPHMR